MSQFFLMNNKSQKRLLYVGHPFLCHFLKGEKKVFLSSTNMLLDHVFFLAASLTKCPTFIDSSTKCCHLFRIFHFYLSDLFLFTRSQSWSETDLLDK